jgi:hypothetical protein
MKKALLLFLLFVSFVSNEAISQCGQISLIGEFNIWGDDYWMTQDPINQDVWTTVISLNNSMNNEGAADIIVMKFRADTSWTANWGAESFPMGIGVLNGPNIPVPIDTNAVSTDYFVTFNCSTGEYNFANVSVTAVRAYSMTIDGNLDEPEWDLNRSVSKVINGTVTADPNEVLFGVAYDDNYLYVGLNVIDAFPTIYEMGEVFIDGDKSGGPYDAHDLHLRFNGPVVSIVQGPPTLVPLIGFQLIVGGYSAELGIPLADLGIIPTPESQIGFDIIIGDGDSGTGVDYMMSWVGGLENYEVTSSFGTLNFADFTGLDEFEDYSAFVVLFPNPSNSNVSLHLANDVFNGNVNICVTDMAGRVVQSNRLNFHGASDQILLNVNQLTPGIYFVNIYGNNGSRAVKKLIVQ